MIEHTHSLVRFNTMERIIHKGCDVSVVVRIWTLNELLTLALTQKHSHKYRLYTYLLQLYNEY